MAGSSKSRAYKELTLQQLRSFCETARRGSLKGAAESLGLAHPTVWQQVHALERELAAKLVEPHGRGCRLTADGRLFVELLSPLVTGIESLKRSFQAARVQAQARVTLATTQRTLVEDLPRAIVAFERRHPHVHIGLKEVATEEVVPVVESGQADLGLTSRRDAGNPWLDCEPCYELDLILVTRRDHPLARRRRVTPKDLRNYPLVNAPDNIPDPAIQATLDKLGVTGRGQQRVEARYTAVIRRYVELGFGIGLIVGLSGRGSTNAKLHERSLSRHFGRIPVYLVSRRGALQQESARAFADTVRAELRAK